MHEVVIVLSDLYVSQEALERERTDGIALPGLEHVTRFAARTKLEAGWRPWLAQWLSGGGLAAAAPGTVAAWAVTSRGVIKPGNTPRSPIATVWMATPVHLVAGLTTLHFDRRSILRLPATELAALASEFHRAFHDSGFLLQPLESGDFLLFGPEVPVAVTLEPARSMGENVAEGLRGGTGAAVLRRLGGEIEMWLHDHPVNHGRQGRGELPVTGLWLWGGGPMPMQVDARTAQAAGAIPVAGIIDIAEPMPPSAVAHVGGDARSANEAGAPIIADQAGEGACDIAFGSDAYLQGLWASVGANVFPLPQQLADIFSYPRAQRAVLVVDVGHMLHSNPNWTFFDALAHIDRCFIAPGADGLRRGDFERLDIVANDRQLTLRSRDRFKFWRRALPGLSGLQ